MCKERKKTCEETGSQTVKENCKSGSKESSQNNHKGECKVCSERNCKGFGKSSGNGGRTAAGPIAGIAAGEITGMKMDMEDVKHTNRIRKLKYFRDKLQSQDMQTDSLAKLVKDLFLQKIQCRYKICCEIYDYILTFTSCFSCNCCGSGSSGCCSGIQFSTCHISPTIGFGRDSTERFISIYG